MTSERPGELVLVRHGETEWSKSGQHTGRTDIPLTDNGVEQAKRAGRYLGDRSFALALSSPLQRARDTAHLIGVEPEARRGPVRVGLRRVRGPHHPADQGAAPRSVGPLDRRGPRWRHPR
ncbi:histidine phosphatase family protein [Curtobacterium flaccumfaciens]|uniref:histidine phosphatase family protein n=1 Tax=Curtobacterium flaccumfaciens TaxID=2035 RepID=UPI0021C587F7|nr:histidine phosphatase family protein [Curtobacterium flaccumfaciens]